MRKREREAAPPRCDEDSAPWGEEAPQPRAPKLCKLKTVPLRPRNQMPRNSPLPPRDPAPLAPSPALSHGGTRDSTGSSFVRCFCCNQSIAISSYNLHLDHECKGRGGGGTQSKEVCSTEELAVAELPPPSGLLSKLLVNFPYPLIPELVGLDVLPCMD